MRYFLRAYFTFEKRVKLLHLITLQRQTTIYFL